MSLEDTLTFLGVRTHIDFKIPLKGFSATGVSLTP